MPKFKNKKTGKIVEENLLYYIEKYKNDPNYKEIVAKQPKRNKPVEKPIEVEEEKPLQ